MLAKVAKFNNAVVVDDLNSSKAAVENLSDCFTEKMLNTIENVFEKQSIIAGGKRRWSPMHHIEDDSDRMLAICQNIIDHDGEFRPFADYEVSEEWVTREWVDGEWEVVDE